MLKRFFRQVNNAVLASLSALIFFILGFLWWIFDANTLVPMWVLSTVIIACYLVCIVVYGLCSMQRDTSVYRLPKIKNIVEHNNDYIFIVEKNDLFTQGSYATICFQEDDDSLEAVLGIGYVQSINTSGYLQVVVEKLSSIESALEIYKKIKNTKYYRESIKIKPSIHKELFEEESGNG